MPVRLSRIERLLGLSVAGEEMATLLEPIGFDVAQGTEPGLVVVGVPGARPDVTREVDVIEEVARRRGYDSFEERLLPFRPSNAPDDLLGAVVAEIHRQFARWGFLEARTAGFAGSHDSRVPLLNPLSSEESHLRDELLPGLLRRVEHNWSHGVRDIRLYEVGTAFFPVEGDALPTEEMRVALGEDTAAGLFSNDDGLRDRFVAAGSSTFERVWPLPLYREFRKAMDSSVADLRNSSATRWGGASTAAAFLQEFVDYPWVHLDIAGMAYSGKDRAYAAKGGSGFGVRLLLRWLQES